MLEAVTAFMIAQESLKIQNCLGYSKAIEVVEIARDSDINKDNFTEMLIKSTVNSEFKSIIARNIELVYALPKFSKYSKGFYNQCIEKGYVMQYSVTYHYF